MVVVFHRRLDAEENIWDLQKIPTIAQTFWDMRSPPI